MQSSEDFKSLSDHILNLGTEILSVDIVDYSGECLARSVRREIKDVLGVDTTFVKRWAVWTILLISLAKQFDSELSESEYVVIGRKNFKRVFIPIPSKDIVLALVVSKFVEATQVNEKIREFLSSALRNSQPVRK